MNLQLKDKIAFITGAFSGIGAVTPRVLAEDGANVVVGYRANLEPLTQSVHQRQ